MKEYLFTAKRLDNGQWVEGWYDGCYGNATINYLKSNGIAYNVVVIPETVRQFTGLTDKNGKRIFEGDIIRAYKHNEIMFVETITLIQNVYHFGSFNFIEFQNIFRNIEVIGNIFDYADLLKGADE